MPDSGGRVPQLRRALTRGALVAFRHLPPPARRLVVRLGTPSFTVGAVCALVHDGEVLLLRQRHRDDWSLPGGLLDRGEAPDTAVRRELREELGLEVEVGSPTATLVDPHVRRVDVIYRIDLPARIEVEPRGEAFQAQWIRPEFLGEGSEATAAALAEMASAVRAGATGVTSGRLLAPPTT